ncbi:symmetrical bis(5'-nucleosyl)-tetraphosphatase [Melaminivora jejuensis]|uniref:symmetrical bis(5'-nucleosyl)-tetraphosphatase n=1 Tax=Melaminivora jejuensis TaxID=1267217 RepID=UPI001AE0E716|nr:symmetrical bis(5'-nucleosyl)-tetraphosphatase [Melaminivora jejuensis]UHJ64226.1 symmetrical bis(5'-nucleosyl)-tetraphosphatase [Melaminivora jejuensis]
MSVYCMGDLQGCHDAFERMLAEIGFSPSRDRLYLLGDLVNRGPQSAQVLRHCRTLEDSVFPVLGNHDLHLLAVAHGARKPSRRDTLESILQAPDCAELLQWLRRQPLARRVEHGGGAFLTLHAGVLPQWDAALVLELAGQVQQVLQSAQLPDFLAQMYGNEPAVWSDGLAGAGRLRVIVNALTRLRFCTPQGHMDFDSAESAQQAPAGLVPWFEAPGRRSADTLIAFGHWSTLGLLDRPHLLGLDTGCVWGGALSAVRLGATLDEREFFQVRCPQAQAPG